MWGAGGGGGSSLNYSLRCKGLSSTTAMGPMTAMATPLMSTVAHHAPTQCEEMIVGHSSRRVDREV